MQNKIITLPEAPGEKKERPFTELSFKPFLDYIRMRVEEGNSIKKDIYLMILQKFSKYPELEGTVTLEEIGKYGDILDLLHMALSNVVEDETKLLWGIS